MHIKTAMVLAAGKGERMRPLTDTCPKPMIVVAGKTMIDHAIDQLQAEKIEKVVVNVCHHGSMIVDHLKNRTAPLMTFSTESERLETGGGILKALPELGVHPFFVINGDVLWSNKNGRVLHLLREAWKDTMDALLLMVPLKNARGYDGVGDYDMRSSGQLRKRSKDQAQYVYGGVQILHPRLFQGETEEIFSLKKLYDKAEQKGTLFGLGHKSLWFHVGTPESLMETRTWFEEHSFIDS